MKGPMKGLKFILGSMEGKGGGASVYFDMIEGPQTKAFAHTVQVGHVFFDIGANVGYYTLLASKLIGNTGKVVAVEPSVRNIAYLYKHVQINKLKNVSIVSAAASNNISITIFSQSDNNAMGHIADKGVFDIKAASTLIPVVTISIDELIKSTGVNPDVIKIDVEGAETDVLNGMKDLLQTKPPIIFLSIHSDDLRKECLSFLQNYKYNFKLLSSEKNILFEYLCTVDGLNQ